MKTTARVILIALLPMIAAADALAVPNWRGQLWPTDHGTSGLASMYRERHRQWSQREFWLRTTAWACPIFGPPNVHFNF